MLMMLAFFGGLGPPGPADAHDAGPGWDGAKAPNGPADAHDAGLLGHWEKLVAQLMLMMLACTGANMLQIQLMLMMLACFGHWPNYMSS